MPSAMITMNIGVITRLPFSTVRSLRAVPLRGRREPALDELDQPVLLELVLVLAPSLASFHAVQTRNRPKM